MPSQADGQGPIFLSATDYELPKTLPEGVDKYTGFREMARGGSAVLRTCFDQMTGRTVVMKSLLTKYLLDKKENQRLLREARITAQLQHPNTVPVYDIGRDHRQGLYFTMKRISGEKRSEILLLVCNFVSLATQRCVVITVILQTSQSAVEKTTFYLQLLNLMFSHPNNVCYDNVLVQMSN